MCIVAFVATFFSFAFLASPAGAMPPPPGCCAVTWEQQSVGSTTVRKLGAGTMVNNDPSHSQVRAHVDINSDACWAKSVHEYADRNFFTDIDLGNLTPGDVLANRRKSPSYDTDWTTPPTNSSPFSSNSDIYVVVTISCQTSHGIEDVKPTFKSAFLRVPDRKIVKDEEKVQEGSNINASGNASGKIGNGAAGAGVNITGGIKRTSDGTTITDASFLDPDVRISLAPLAPLPPHWSLALTPDRFSLQAKQSRSIDLLYAAPARGTAVYAIQMNVKGPTGAISRTSEPHLLVVDGPSTAWQPTRLAIAHRFICKGWWSSSNVSLAAITQVPTGRGRLTTMDVRASRAGEVTVVLSRGIVGTATPGVTVDGNSVVPHVISKNAFVQFLDIPVPAGSHRVSLRAASVGSGC